MGPRREKSVRVAKSEKSVAGTSIDIHASQWEAPFDLTPFPPELEKECIRCAPFLLGGQNAKYDADFFKRVVNLNDEGNVMADFTESKCPREKFEEEWPQVEGRYYLANAKNKRVRDAALRTYIQVYGGPPDNGGVGTQFLCAVYMETIHGEKINWTEWAAKITNDRLKNAGRNPMKLTPPALREQIERLLKILGDAASAGTNNKTTPQDKQQEYTSKQSEQDRLGKAKLDPKGAPSQQTITLESASKKVEQPRSSKEKVDQKRLEPKSGQKELMYSKGAIIPTSAQVPLRQGKGRKGKEIDKAVTIVENFDVKLEADLEDIRRQKVACEGLLTRLQSKQCYIKAKFAEATLQHSRVDAESSRLGDTFTYMHQRRQILIKEGDIKGKKEIDAQMQKNAQELVVVTKKLENVDGSLTKLEGELEESEQAIFSAESNLKKVKSQEQQLILETTTVKPREVFWKLPHQLQELHLKGELPCARCYMFFVDGAAVPFSCGCLFHPHCMWTIVLVGGNICPRCSGEGTPHWMSQWGFSMSTEMSHHVTETLMNMDSLGWREPAELNTKQWGLKKRVREVDENVDSLPVKMHKIEDSWQVDKRQLEEKTNQEDVRLKVFFKPVVEATGELEPKHQLEEPSLVMKELEPKLSDHAKLKEHSLDAWDSEPKVRELGKRLLDTKPLEEKQNIEDLLLVAKGIEPKAVNQRKLGEHLLDVGDSKPLEPKKLEEPMVVAEELEPKVSPHKKFGEQLLLTQDLESKVQNQKDVGDTNKDTKDLDAKMLNKKKVEEQDLGDSDSKVQEQLVGATRAVLGYLDVQTLNHKALTKEDEQELENVLTNLFTSP